MSVGFAAGILALGIGALCALMRSPRCDRNRALRRAGMAAAIIAVLAAGAYLGAAALLILR